MSLFGGQNNNEKDKAGSTGFNLFGGSSNTDTKTGGSSGGLFGGNTSSGGLFGTNNTTPASSGGGTGLFGKTEEKKDQSSSSGGLFGASSNSSSLFSSTTPANSTSTGLFGTTDSNKKPTTTATEQKSTSSSLFGGSSTETKPSAGLFATSSKPTADATSSTSTSLFGSKSAKPEKKQDSSLLINSSTEPPTAAAPSLFSSDAPKDAEAPKGSSLFGSSNEKKTEENNLALGGDKKKVGFDLDQNKTKLIPGNAVTDDLHGLSVEEILLQWKEKLTKHVELFAKASEEVKERELKIVRNEEKIAEVGRQAQIAKSEHKEVQWKLDSVLELQADLNSTLDDLEKEMEELEIEKARSRPIYDERMEMRRREMYESVGDLDSKLTSMEVELGEIKKVLGETTQSKGFGKKMPIADILKKQQMSMNWLRDGTSRLFREINELQDQLNRA
eukprot:snap_masked-scaffold_2-processed-gene-4.23-mRNA-1 protein AED:1.00 eAED:1.00 QI:0/-1/0/0/-1/1/1/0/444